MSTYQPNSKYDAAARRRAQRRGRERGCWVFVPAEELVKAGFDPHGPPPLYRTWGTKSGGVLVRLYKEEPASNGPRQEVHFCLECRHLRRFTEGKCDHCAGLIAWSAPTPREA